MKYGEAIRGEFPAFSVDYPVPLAFLDSAASSLKCARVIDRITRYLQHEHANIHRGAYRLSATATQNYEAARAKVAQFIGAVDHAEVVFTKSATEAINLVACGIQDFFKSRDAVLVSLLEHHSNIVPWQLLAERRGLSLEFVNITPRAELDLDDLRKKLTSLRPRVLAVTWISNAFGTVVPIKEVISLAKEVGTLVVVDATQVPAHQCIDVAELDVDFLVFSGHKIYGPTGIGILYAKRHHLEEMVPYQGGGEMISTVTTAGSTWAEVPAKFEAGTPPIAEAIALGTTIDFLEDLNLPELSIYEHSLFEHAWHELSKEPGVTLYGPHCAGAHSEGVHSTDAYQQSGVIAFNIEGVHPHDFATIADEKHNVQVRAGHHCAMPALTHLGLTATCRASIGAYTTEQDFAALRAAIRDARALLG